MATEAIPADVIRRIAKELTELTNTPLEGIKISLNEEDITDVYASIEGPAGTPYDGGLFKMRLRLGSDFPKAPPKAFFLSKIFHPNVSKKGEICVNTLKKDWKEDLGIKHILLTVKCLLIVPNPESALNEEASRLLLEDYDDYFKHAKLFTSIHAQKQSEKTEEPVTNVNNENTNGNTPQASAKVPEKGAGEKKKVVEKKKSLKRL